MDERTDAQDVHRCDLCEESMVDMLCVVCPQKLCKSCVGDHVYDDPSRHKLVKYQYRTRLSFFQYVPHTPPRNDVNTSAKNAIKLFAHLAFLPICTRNMYS